MTTSLFSYAWNGAIDVTQWPDILITVSDAAGGDDGNLSTEKQLTTKANFLRNGTALDSRNPVILKATFMIFFTLVGFVGNGITLAAIRQSPILRTKTYALLASLTVADLLTGVTVLWTMAFQLLVYVFSEDPCLFILPVAALRFPERLPVAVTITHIGVISFERYIAVVYPLRYEAWITDRSVKAMIAFGWLFPAVPFSVYFTYIGGINWHTCTIDASVQQVALVDVCHIMLVIVVIVVFQSCILTTALRQRAKINSEVSNCFQCDSAGSLVSAVLLQRVLTIGILAKRRMQKPSALACTLVKPETQENHAYKCIFYYEQAVLPC